MKNIIFLATITLLLFSSSCKKSDPELFPKFSYTFDGIDVSNSNYQKSFTINGNNLTITLEEGGHVVTIILNDYNGVGTYDPFYLTYRFEEEVTYYGQATKTVKITSVNENHIQGTFSGELEKPFSALSKTLSSGTFDVLLN